MQFQRISILPSQKGLEFPEGGGFRKIKKYKEMYEALPEFSEGWGRYGYFLELHIVSDDQHSSTTFGTTKNIFFKNDNC